MENRVNGLLYLKVSKSCANETGEKLLALSLGVCVCESVEEQTFRVWDTSERFARSKQKHLRTGFSTTVGVAVLFSSVGFSSVKASKIAPRNKRTTFGTIESEVGI